MADRGSAARLARRATPLALALALGAAATASADIEGVVRTPAGEPVPGVTVEAIGAGGAVAGRDNTDGSGVYDIQSVGLTGPGPYTLAVETLTCRRGAEGPARASAGPVDDGQGADLILDVRLQCLALEPDPPEPGGHVWPERGLFLGLPGAGFALDVLAPFEASEHRVSVADGTVIGTGPRLNLRFTAPRVPYEGPLALTSVIGAGTAQRSLGRLVARRPGARLPDRGRADLAVILDTSGSVRDGDPGGVRRRAAVRALVDLSRRGDRLAALGFAEQPVTIFGRRPVTTAASRAILRRLASRPIADAGATDYNAGLAGGFAALSAAPLRPGVPKGAIFVTDGAHNEGVYGNPHLRFALNDTRRPWPVCVVQLGPQLAPGATARLRRIARETRGAYRRALVASRLETAVAGCRASLTGARTRLDRAIALRQGRQRALARAVPRRAREATFLVGFGAGRYRVAVTDPAGRRVTARVRGARVLRGPTYAGVTVLGPAPGRWTVTVTRLAGGPRVGTASVLMTTR